MTEEAINAIETRHRQLPISCNDVPALIAALREANAKIHKLLQRKPHVGVEKEQSHETL